MMQYRIYFIPLEESSSCHLLGALEDLLKRSHNDSTFTKNIKYCSKSLDDLLINRRKQCLRTINNDSDDNNNISSTTRTAFDLTDIGYDDDDDDDEDNEYNLETQRSRSAPVSPTKIYDKQLTAFMQCDQSAQQSLLDNCVHNVDLSDSDKHLHQSHSRKIILFVRLFILCRIDS